MNLQHKQITIVKEKLRGITKLPKEFKFAIAASKKSDLYQHKLGAAVYHNGKFITSGFNQQKTHPIMRKYNENLKTLHAEIHAITKAKAIKFDISGSTVFIFRQKKSGDLGMAKPCSVCMEILKDFDVKEIIFTSESGYDRIKM